MRQNVVSEVYHCLKKDGTVAKRSGKAKDSRAGWFSVDRSLLGSDLWLGEPFTRGQAWIDLIGLARFEGGSVRLKGTLLEVARGKVARSEGNLADRWMWSRGKVRRFLNELEIEQRIVQQKTNVTTLIELINYDQYQHGGTANGTGRSTGNGTEGGTADGTADGTRNKKYNNANNNPPPTPSKTEPVSSKPPNPWEGVEEELFAAGVTTAPRVVSELRARGAPTELARAVIAHWRQSQPAWGPGALASRLEALRTGQSPTELWPQIDKAAEVVKSRDRSLQKQAELERQKVNAKQTLKQNDSKMLELESRYGEYLDSMTEKQVRKFAVNCGLNLLLKSYRSEEGVTGLLRESLLLDMGNSNFELPREAVTS